MGLGCLTRLLLGRRYDAMHAAAQGTKTRPSNHAHRTLQIQPDQHTLQSDDTRGRVLVRTRMLSDSIEQHRHAFPLLILRQGCRDHLRVGRIDARLARVVWKGVRQVGQWPTRGERRHVRLGCRYSSASSGAARRGCFRRWRGNRRLCIAFRLCLFGFHGRPPPATCKGQIGEPDGMRVFRDICVHTRSRLPQKAGKRTRTTDTDFVRIKIGLVADRRLTPLSLELGEPASTNVVVCRRERSLFCWAPCALFQDVS